MIDHLTNSLATATRRYATSKGETRAALERRLRTQVANAERQRDELVAWLNDRDGWFWRNPDSPKRAEREDAWIVVLREYEAVEDGIAAARTALGGGDAR